MIIKLIKLLFKLKCKLLLLNSNSSINDLIYLKHCLIFDLHDIIYEFEENDLINTL